MIATGPDSRVSWRNAILAGLIQIPVLISLKTTGVIFVGFLNQWHIQREQASWPLSLHIVSSQICAPLLSLLRKRFSLSSLLTVSCALLAATQFLAYYAENVFHFSISFVFQGMAVAGVYMFSTAIFMQHFEKKRTAATGVASAISSGVTTFAPNLLQCVIKQLGLKMAIPVLGGVTSVSLLLSFFLKSPRWFIERQRERAQLEENDKQVTAVEKQSFIPPHGGTKVSDEATTEHIPAHYMLSGKFVMDVLCIIVIYNANNTFLMIAFDYARDQGIPEAAALYVLPLSAIGDLMLRILSGFLIDSRLVSWNVLFAGAFFIEAICLLIWVMSSQLSTLLVVALLVGGCNGALVSLIPALLVNDFGITRFTDTFGAALFVCGVVTCFKPLLDGYFRDVRGSYNGLFLVVIALCIPCGAYWLYRMYAESGTGDKKPMAKENSEA